MSIISSFSVIINQFATCSTSKNSCTPHLAALLRTIYALLGQFGCLISTCHLPGVTNTLAEAISHGWLHRFFELCTYADPMPTSIIRYNFDFSDLETAAARWPCRDVGGQPLSACEVGYISAVWRPLPSKEMAAWVPPAAISDSHGVLGVAGSPVVGWMGQGHVDHDSNGPSESQCKMNGGGSQWHGCAGWGSRDTLAQRSVQGQGFSGC